ncbi:MAG: GNAT family N-acetyltransferase [Anaerolineales bacterium]|nr:GNAT family N-acetyltransferase [Anaerolineales bacterium]
MCSDIRMLDQLIIRLARRQDLPALEWEGEFTHYRNIFREAYQRYQKGETLLWIAELGQFGLVGQAFVQLQGTQPDLADGQERAYIYSIRVRPIYQNQGIGTRLLRTIEADLVARQYRYATLNVAKDNQSARRLYERLGYHVVAHEAGRWSYVDHRGKRQHVHEPAWRMEKNLQEGNLAGR